MTFSVTSTPEGIAPLYPCVKHYVTFACELEVLWGKTSVAYQGMSPPRPCLADNDLQGDRKLKHEPAVPNHGGKNYPEQLGLRIPAV